MIDWNDEFWHAPRRRPPPVRSSTVTSLNEDGDYLRSNDIPRPYIPKSQYLRRQLSHQLSTTSSSTGGSSPRTNYKTHESSLTDSRISSWSSIFFDDTDPSDNSNSQSSSNLPPAYSFNPLVEKGIDLMSSDSDNYFTEASNKGRRHSQGNVLFLDQSYSRPKELIIPDEEEEYPFARYTFNKKPDRDALSSHSDKSSSSRESLHEMPGSRNKSFSSSSRSNMTSSSLSSSMSEVPSNWSIDTNGYTPQPPPPAPPPPPPQQVSQPQINYHSLAQSWPHYPPEQLIQAPQPGFMSPMAAPNPLMMSQFGQTLPMEQVLMNLGFAGASDSFLPERFARDWYIKLMKHQEMIRQQQLEMLFSDTSDADYSNSSMQSSGYNTPLWKCPSDINIRSSLAANKQKFYSNANSQNVSFDLGPGSGLDRQTSIEKLRELLHYQAKNDNSLMSFQVNKDFRRKCFANARQKSLPAYLETLDEEDEGKKSKKIRQKSSKSDNSSVGSPQQSITSNEESASEHQGESESHDSQDQSTDNSTTSGSQIVSPHFWKPRDINDELIPKQRKRDFERSESSSSLNKNLEKTPSSNNIPSIVIKSHSHTPSPSLTKDHLSSADSMEVADILMKNNETGLTDLNVEPAMMSFNLHDDDYDDNVPNKSLLNLPLNTSHDTSVGSSPAPLSPVTVIEVGQLDNQNDSLDGDDNMHGNILSCSTSTESTTVNDSILKVNRHHGLHSGRKSPVPDRSKKKVSIELPKQEKDVSIQADDGSLPPIIKFSDFDFIIKKLSELDDAGFYFGRDQGTQCDIILGNDRVMDYLKIDYEADFCSIDKNIVGNYPVATSSRKHSLIEKPVIVKDSVCQTIYSDITENKGVQTEIFSVEFDNFMFSTSDESGTESENLNTFDKENYPPFGYKPHNMSNSSQNPSYRYTPLEITLERLERKTRKWRSKHQTGDKKS